MDYFTVYCKIRGFTLSHSTTPKLIVFRTPLENEWIENKATSSLQSYHLLHGDHYTTGIFLSVTWKPTSQITFGKLVSALASCIQQFYKTRYLIFFSEDVTGISSKCYNLFCQWNPLWTNIYRVKWLMFFESHNVTGDHWSNREVKGIITMQY